VFVPAEYVTYANALLERERAAVFGMDPRDWTRELADEVIDVRWSRLSLKYMEACARSRRPMDVRDYWVYLWAAADAGLVTGEQTPMALAMSVQGSYQGNGDPTPPSGFGWPPRWVFRDATPAELVARSRTRADLVLYGDKLTEAVGWTDGASRSFASLRRDVAAVGQYALDRGITGRPSEVTTEWLAAHNITGRVLSDVAHMANLAIFQFADVGLVSPAHGWQAASAYNDGNAVWHAAQTAYILAGYVDPDFISPVPTAPWELPAGAPPPPPPETPGTGNGPVTGAPPVIDTPPGEGPPPPPPGTPPPPGSGTPAGTGGQTQSRAGLDVPPLAWLALGAAVLLGGSHLLSES
jgi:hypothetical protein